MNRLFRNAFLTALLIIGICGLLASHSVTVDEGIDRAGSFWQREDVSIDEDELTVTTSGKDSTHVFQGAPFMTLTVLPAYSANEDSFYTDGDSTSVQIELRSWSDKSRKVQLRNLTLFSSFQMQCAAVSTNYDSATITVASPDSQFIPYYDVLFTGKGSTGNGAKYKVRVFKHD